MIKTNIELAEIAKQVANNYKSLYVHGAFGSPMPFARKNGYIQGLGFNQSAERKAKMNSASDDTFGFDCSGFIKALLWGWCGDASKEYGGAKYQSNSVPDINADSIMAACEDFSTNFSNILPGEVVWKPGHIGIYIGDGLAVECTYRWEDGVQVTAVENINTKPGYNGRTWTRHGKLPWIAYSAPEHTLKEGEFEMVMRVIDGKSKGDDVRAMQILLEANGCKGEMNPALYGSSGSKTVAAIEMFQRKTGLPVTGQCDEKTWKKLLGV